ncbi:Pc22g24950 [Penicillium rubens Wisconsin 54-1255]|uniref:Pc22g24950 protein n=1 Tax=Penicillium rubens (strain ATCC 28089 / DSM 1075 / NRRL 1951 / Wisconsin 54-1255) TaxID=500485 RepID=B6HRN5_PENRW|nr:Pc22g24950 [Penicillium rubens Wisconsin 54-1255]
MFQLRSIFLIALSCAHLVSSHPLLNRANYDKAGDSHWVNIWTTMPQLVEPANLPPIPFNGSTAVFGNTTIRQTLQVSLAAQEIRIRLSNAFGPNELKITNVTIGLPERQRVGVSGLQTKTLKTVTFNGGPDVDIPNGGMVVSDPIKFPVKAQSAVMISMYLAEGQHGFAITGHPGSRTTSYLAFGDWTGAKNLTDSSVQSTDHWYFVSGVEARLPSKSSGWPDLLLARMQKHEPTSNIAVLNQAAGGNRILQDGLGPNVISRLDRDVLAQSGAEIEKKLVAAYEQIATRVHALGIPLFGATITPFGSSASSDYVQPYSSPEREKTRQQINKFIRQSGVFDAVLDFDRVLRDPQVPSQLLKQYDIGDHLHPSVAGYQALADYFPLGLFE